MTDIAKLREAVVEAAKRWNRGGVGTGNDLDAAVLALRAAEEAEKRPRLKAPRDAISLVWPSDKCDATWKQAADDIARRDAEWLAAIRKLRRWDVDIHAPIGDAFRSHPSGKFIALSDIEALAESAK